ncbi:MAG: type II toxin-antitoxin system RelE/ParE family toxin [Gemmobacter sp.]
MCSTISGCPRRTGWRRCGGDRAEQYSIRINDQWRICFAWGDNGPEDIEIVDYH